MPPGLLPGLYPGPIGGVTAAPKTPVESGLCPKLWMCHWQLSSFTEKTFCRMHA